MNTIHLLPPEIAQKIAAGEVIERPVSVLKELVENSLDAAASMVRVDLAGGGKVLVRVIDNGGGMGREDALLCFERHSTSKISTEEDLWRISSLGFRGEALASISAVSRLILRTSDGKEGKGTQIEREGERVLKVSDIAFPQGTTVEVRDLFFNLPARQKFLRSDRSELGLAVKYLTFVALAYPEVGFTLSQGTREILNCPAVAGTRERIFQLYGRAVLERLMECQHAEQGYDVRGFASRPPSGRQDRAHQFFFVNRRPVKDRILQAALNQAFRGSLEKDQSPEAFLFLRLPFSDVDVNVHPAKTEVRFKESQLVFHLILRCLERSLLKGKGSREVYPAEREERSEGRVRDAPGQHDFASLFPTPAADSGSHPQVLGQYLDTYIVAAGEEGLLVIDQHNAHERVLFEKYKEIDSHRSWPRKMPLVPPLLDLSPPEALALEDNQAELEGAGFRAQAMGGRSYALVEYPDILKEEEAQEIFLAVLGEMKEAGPIERRERLLATLACKTAIKAYQPLSWEKMDYLVRELFRTSRPSLCPHGRPILVKVERSEIEKGMRRAPKS